MGEARSDGAGHETEPPPRGPSRASGVHIVRLACAANREAQRIRSPGSEGRRGQAARRRRLLTGVKHFADNEAPQSDAHEKNETVASAPRRGMGVRATAKV